MAWYTDNVVVRDKPGFAEEKRKDDDRNTR